ncbi:Colonization factor antigen I subunit E [Serratia fonticola]|uniref:CfaE/CblD family pilus tip adhesin n=2 Tax=Serratia fonticola TaxID=47917 RepID=UPI0009B93115|nr:CfaE/CblD family pilus tip adhesin [Serratia fonticola]CAI1630541.1 Colonization factor antigen I subunit E [Serratia fonticola]
MLLEKNSSLRYLCAEIVKTVTLCGLFFAVPVALVQGASVTPQTPDNAHSKISGAKVRDVTNIPPQAQDTVVNMSFDRMSLPTNVFIWQNVFGGSSSVTTCGSTNGIACSNLDFINSLVCYSTSDPTYGACPVLLWWWSGSGVSNSTSLTLRFTHDGGETKDLQITSFKNRADDSPVGSWVSGRVVSPEGFRTFIPSSELNKLSTAGIWRAKLKMQVKAWDSCSNWSTNACPGIHRVDWTATITLNVTDYGNQQIYLPAFPTSAPSVNLNLNTRPGAGSRKSVSGSTNLDMCLYDGNNSASNRISLLLQDEGGTATGRPDGQFSIYRKGGDQSKASDRLDYQVSVINPTTGAVQDISNGKEIIWSDTNRRNIQRPVVLPGGGAPALCVPAPLTLTTPAFSMADKTAGDYTGTLRIIYTPTTQQ